ncbi:hypothetical protein K9M41_02235 [Candidatus Gracilibacteria bacterium]|nr:hypothetical protein [Candidatus Gracilibacteria bacterium]
MMKTKTADFTYLINDEGTKTSVVIPIEIFIQEDSDDLYDRIVAQSRLEKDEFIPFK